MRTKLELFVPAQKIYKNGCIQVPPKDHWQAKPKFLKNTDNIKKIYV